MVKRRFENDELYYCGEMSGNEGERYLIETSDQLSENRIAESVVIMPLVRNGEIIGVYSIQSKLRNAYDKEKLEIIKNLAPFITIAVENAILDDKIKKNLEKNRDLKQQIKQLDNKIMIESRLDGLTRVYNKEHFFSSSQQLLQKSGLSRRQFGFYVVDVDDFTAYNDYYGVAEGDCVLNALAEQLSAHFKSGNQILGRYGGGRFVEAVVGGSVGDLVVKGQLLIERVKALAIPYEKSPHGTITVSVGLVYLMPEGQEDIKAIFRCAENYMDKAREDGGCQLRHGKCR